MSGPLRKLFYPPGLISLALLPILLCVNLKTHLQKDDLYALEVLYPSKKNITAKDTIGNDGTTKHEFLMIQNLIKYASWQKVILTGSEEDNVKLAYIKITLREMMQNKSTVTGIEIALTPHTKYKSLVALYDICKTGHAPQYLHYQNKFWILNSATKEPTEIRIDCATRMHCIPVKISNTETSFSKCLSFIAEHFIFICSSAIILLSSLRRNTFYIPCTKNNVGHVNLKN